jgi:curved DNA-binding protein CbpA
MFHDYYSILEIEFGASIEEIRSAYKKQAIIWHPDKNNGKDTLNQMQLINEAYLILKDTDARILYDKEYLKFKAFQSFHADSESTPNQSDQYVSSDELLKKWMSNARQQADTLAKQTAYNFKIGAKAAGKEIIDRTIGFIIAGLVISIFILAVKSCN